MHTSHHVLDSRYQLTLHSEKVKLLKLYYLILKNFFPRSCNAIQCILFVVAGIKLSLLLCCILYASYFPLHILTIALNIIRFAVTRKESSRFYRIYSLLISVSGHKIYILCGCKTSNSWMEIIREKKEYVCM